MLSARTLISLIVLTALAVAAAVYVNRPQSSAAPEVGQPVFAGLLSRINDVATIVVTSADGPIVIEHDNGAWAVKQRDGYPATIEKVRGVLVGVAQLVTVEPKTSNPELYDQLELEDVASPDAKSISLELLDAEGTALAALIVGKQRFGRAGAGSRETYIRLPDDPQTWLVKGDLPVERKIEDWLDRDVLDLDQQSIREVRITHEDGEKLVVRRGNADQTDFEIEDLPQGMKIKSSYTVNNIAGTFSRLRLDDVMSVANAGLPDEPLATVDLVTLDGVQLAMKTYNKDGKDMATFKADFVPPPAADVEQLETESSEAGEGEETQASAATEEKDPRQRAVELNERLENWAFVLPDHSITNIVRRQADLVEEQEATTESEADSDASQQ